MLTFCRRWLALQGARTFGLPAAVFQCDKRCFSDSGGEEEEVVERYSRDSIPRDKLTISFSRSRGPGGQNVNKLNTKAELRFHLNSADWISERARERVKTMFPSKLNREGELLVVSQKHRSQLRNLDDALSKLGQLLSQAAELPRAPSTLTLARVKALKRKAERKRLVQKKYHSLKKSSRTSDDL